MKATTFFVHPLPPINEFLLLSDFELIRDTRVTLAEEFVDSFNAFVAADKKFKPPSMLTLENIRKMRQEILAYMATVRAWFVQLCDLSTAEEDERDKIAACLMRKELTVEYWFSFKQVELLNDNFLEHLQRGKKLGISVTLQPQTVLDAAVIHCKFDLQ